MLRWLIMGVLATGFSAAAVPGCGGSSEDVGSTGAGGSAGTGADAAQDARGDARADATVDAGRDRETDCSSVGCSPPPLCSEGCQAICGCCACAEGSTMGEYVCRGGCYAPAGDASSDAAVDAGADAGTTSDWTAFIVETGYGPCPAGQVCSSRWRVTPDGAIAAKKEGVDSTPRMSEADRRELDELLRRDSFRRDMVDGFDCPVVFDVFTSITLETPAPSTQNVAGCVVNGPSSARPVARAVTLVTQY